MAKRIVVKFTVDEKARTKAWIALTKRVLKMVLAATLIFALWYAYQKQYYNFNWFWIAVDFVKDAWQKM